METTTLRRGATTLPSLEAVSGDVSQVDSITARLRLSVAPSTRVPVTVTPRLDAPAGWDLEIAEGTSAGLAEGLWQLDARLGIGDTILITDPVGVRVVGTASET